MPDQNYPPPIRRINSAMAIIGLTGGGKSSQLARIARWGWTKYHAISDLYTCDGGAYPSWIQKCQKAGIMRVWRLRSRSDKDLAFETLYRATQGWWPRKWDPRTGECDPACELVPPIQQVYKVRCPVGHDLATVETAEQVGDLGNRMCPTCQRAFGPTEQMVERLTYRTPGFPERRIVMFDGLTSMQSWQLSDLGQRFGRLELKGEEAAIGGKVKSGDMSFGGTTRSHVGFAQSRAEELVNNSLGIPGLVEAPIFTALSMETMDEGAVTVSGLKLAGKAKTDEASSWFGNVFEAAVVSDGAGSVIRRLYLGEYIDERNVKHLLKNAAGVLPLYLDDPAMDPKNPDPKLFFTGCDMGKVLDLLDQAALADSAEEDPALGETPGLPDHEIEIGQGEGQLSAQRTLTAASIARPTRPQAASASVGGPATPGPRAVATVAKPITVQSAVAAAVPPQAPAAVAATRTVQANPAVSTAAPAPSAPPPPPVGKSITPIGGAPQSLPSPTALAPAAPPVIPRARAARKPAAAPKA